MSALKDRKGTTVTMRAGHHSGQEVLKEGKVIYMHDTPSATVFCKSQYLKGKLKMGTGEKVTVHQRGVGLGILVQERVLEHYD